MSTRCIGAQLIGLLNIELLIFLNEGAACLIQARLPLNE